MTEKSNQIQYNTTEAKVDPDTYVLPGPTCTITYLEQINLGSGQLITINHIP